MTEYVFDIESDGLYESWQPEVATKITSVQVLCIDTMEFSDELAPQEGDVIIGHNIIDYDLRMLRKFHGVEYTVRPDTYNGVPVTYIDTLLLSKLLQPDMKQHGLKPWGDRLNRQKSQLIYHDLKGTEEHHDQQARDDCLLTLELYKYLCSIANGRECA